MNNTLPNNSELMLEGGSHGILMLHGLGSNFIELTHLAKHLNTEGFTVLVPHIAGYSYGEDIQDWYSWVVDSQERYAELSKRCTTVSVVGLSMGATLALALAAIEKPTSVVLLSAAMGYDGWAMPRYAFLMKFLPLLPFLKNKKYNESGTYGLKNDNKRKSVRKKLANKGIAEIGPNQLSYRQLYEGFVLIANVWKQLKNIDSPLLFMHAVDDETAHPLRVELAMRKVNSKIKRIHYLSNSYHIITADNERQVVNFETAYFLKQQVNNSQEGGSFEMPQILLPELKKMLSH